MYIYFLNIVISKVEVIHIDFIAVPAKETNLVIPLCGILKCGILACKDNYRGIIYDSEKKEY